MGIHPFTFAKFWKPMIEPADFQPPCQLTTLTDILGGVTVTSPNASPSAPTTAASTSARSAASHHAPARSATAHHATRPTAPMAVRNPGYRPSIASVRQFEREIAGVFGNCGGKVRSIDSGVFLRQQMLDLRFCIRLVRLFAFVCTAS